MSPPETSTQKPPERFSISSWPHDSVLGVDKEIIIQKFLDQLPRRHEVAKGDVRISAVVIDVDDKSGRARSIDSLWEPVEL